MQQPLYEADCGYAFLGQLSISSTLFLRKAEYPQCPWGDGK